MYSETALDKPSGTCAVKVTMLEGFLSEARSNNQRLHDSVTHLTNLLARLNGFPRGKDENDKTVEPCGILPHISAALSDNASHLCDLENLILKLENIA